MAQKQTIVFGKQCWRVLPRLWETVRLRAKIQFFYAGLYCGRRGVALDLFRCVRYSSVAHFACSAVCGTKSPWLLLVNNGGKILSTLQNMKRDLHIVVLLRPMNRVAVSPDFQLKL